MRTQATDPSAAIAHYGKQVAAFYNLQRHDWSICERKSRRSYGRKIAPATWIVLRDCEPVVVESMRERMCQTNPKTGRPFKRTVHAWVAGTLVSSQVPQDLTGFRQANYRPRSQGFFFYSDDGKPVNTWSQVVFAPDRKIYVR